MPEQRPTEAPWHWVVRPIGTTFELVHADDGTVIAAVDDEWTARTIVDEVNAQLDAVQADVVAARADRSERHRQIVHAAVIDRRTYNSIGNEFGLTRERIRQIVRDAGYDPTELTRERSQAREVAVRTITCWLCGQPFAKGERERHFAEVKHLGVMHPERSNAIADAYIRGEPVLAIATSYDVDVPEIYRVIDTLGIPHRKKRRTHLHSRAEQRARQRAIIADIEAGELTYAEIAAKHGISTSYVTMLKRYGRARSGMTQEQRRELREAARRAAGGNEPEAEGVEDAQASGGG